jgi:hypothetical protein
MNYPQTTADFEAIYYPDGQCAAVWQCSNRGVVLAYDPFSPEVAMWFCEQCWQEYEQDGFDWLTIVEDRRGQG